MKNPNSDTIKPPRTIRSFVRREGRMSSGQQRALQSLWEKYGVDLTSSQFNFEVLFARNAPCILEIGFGMGHSLLAQAIEHPEYNYLGIEVHRPGVGSLLAGIAANEITNIRIFNSDAIEVLQTAIPDNSLSKVQIFFPDPWPKLKHHKRRLIQEQFVKLLQCKLLVGGCLHLATDWENYAQHMMTVINAIPGYRNMISEGFSLNHPLETRPLTKFELRGKKLGHDVWDLLYVKTK